MAPTSDRLALSQIADAARELSKTVSKTAVRNILTEVRSAAVGLGVIKLRRPLSEAENEQWLELSKLVGDVADMVTERADPSIPAQRQQGVMG
jgi:hypothetical protein